MNTPTLVPAYGRDYKNALEAVKAYEDGKDWVLVDPTSRYNGMYCSRRNFAGVEVKLRYNKLQNFTHVVFGKEV